MNKQQYAECFHIKNRVNGSNYTTVDEIPELKRFIQIVHEHEFYKSLPNDWIYRIIADAFFELANDDLDEINIEPDVYYSDLYKWFGESYADQFCNEYLELYPASKDIWKTIAGGQWMAKDRIYHLVNDFLQENATDENEQ